MFIKEQNHISATYFPGLGCFESEDEAIVQNIGLFSGYVVYRWQNLFWLCYEKQILLIGSLFSSHDEVSSSCPPTWVDNLMLRKSSTPHFKTNKN